MDSFAAAQQERNDKELLRAVVFREPAYARMALSRGANPLATNSDKRSALHLAAEIGSLECVRFLLPLIPTSLRDRLGNTPLMSACGSTHDGSLACALALLPLSDPDAQDRDGMTALVRAASTGKNSCIASLAAVMAPNTLSSQLSLARTAVPPHGYTETAELLHALLEAQELKDELPSHSAMPPRKTRQI